MSTSGGVRGGNREEPSYSIVRQAHRAGFGRASGDEASGQAEKRQNPQRIGTPAL